MDAGTTRAKNWISESNVRYLLAAALWGGGYYLAANFGFALIFPSLPVSIFWPAHAVLLGGLLLVPLQSWTFLLPAVFVAHCFAYLQHGVPPFLTLGGFASMCLGASLGASCARHVLKPELCLGSLRNVNVFLFFCAFLTSFACASLDIALLRIPSGSVVFWKWWLLRFLSIAVPILVIVPALLAWSPEALVSLRGKRFSGAFRTGLLATLLSGLAYAVFVADLEPHGVIPLFLYALVPILLWTAALCGSFMSSMSLSLFAFMAIWGTLHGREGFGGGFNAAEALSLQSFLIAMAVPILLLSATMQERRASLAALQRALDERQRAAESERASATRFSNMFHLSPDAISISIGMQGKILEVNERWQAMFGYTSAEAVGKTAAQLQLYANESLLDRNKETGIIRELEVEMRDKSGNTLKPVVSGGKIGEENVCVTILRDLTEQRRSEEEAQKQREQLMHLTRVAILGELSGALAHELNQPLAAILANAQAARRFMSRDPLDLQEINEILGDIVDEGKHAGEVIRRLRALFMKGESKMQPLEINGLIRDVLEITHSDLIERNVPVILKLDPANREVHGDRVQLQHVMLNLIINACEAMGTVEPTLRQLTVLTDTDRTGNVRVSVADTGEGIAPAMMDKMFESFHTTKVQGMGLGLSISRAIIAEHGGTIAAANNADGGATLRFSLPVRNRVGVSS